MKIVLLSTLCAATFASAKYVWPSDFDKIEDMYYLNDGYIRDGTLSDVILNCGFSAFQPGVQKAAQWLRTPFHDMITYDAATKTGGLDASLQFELGRFENFGLALNQTFGDIQSSYNTRTSASDLLALAMVMAVERCSRLEIPLRLGRIDATSAGPSGVPEANTDRKEMTRIFTKADMSQEDMIKIVACGHSIGGVHRDESPHNINTGPDDHSNRVTFDTTPSEYDNVVVLQYLNDTTKNPLVKAVDDRYNSDKRIYSSDGNVTMNKLSDPSYFLSSCKSILQRMIDTVPAKVVLTDPLTPTDIKPYIQTYQRAGNKTEFTGRIRVRTTASTGRDGSSLNVTLLPKGRKGETLQRIGTQIGMGGGQSYGPQNEQFTWYEFNANPSTEIKSFTIEIKSRNSGSPIIYDNAGTGGYPLNPDILWQTSSTCATYDSTSQKGTIQVVAAVRRSLVKPSIKPMMVITRRDTVTDSVLPKLSLQNATMRRIRAQSGEFDYYTTNVTLPGATVFNTHFDLAVGNSKVEFINTLPLGDSTCALPR